MDDDNNDYPCCTYCGGPIVFLGDLGFLSWFRCRMCGGEQFMRQTEEVSSNTEQGA